MRNRLFAVAVVPALAASLVAPAARAETPAAFTTHRIGSPERSNQIMGVADTGFFAGFEQTTDFVRTLLIGKAGNLQRVPFDESFAGNSLQPNAVGKVAVSTFDRQARTYRLVVVSPDGTKTSPNVDPAWSVIPGGIDDRNIVGASIVLGECLWSGGPCGASAALIDAATGAVTVLGSGDAAAVTARNNGWSAGYLHTGTIWQAVAWEDDGTAHPIGPAIDLTVSGATFFYPSDVNASGAVAGVAGTVGNVAQSRAFSWTPSSSAPILFDGGSHTTSAAYGISNSGVVAGMVMNVDSNDYLTDLVPALWENGVRSEYPTSDCGALLFDINNSYEGVGATVIPDPTYGGRPMGVRFTPRRSRLVSDVLKLARDDCNGDLTVRHPLRLFGLRGDGARTLLGNILGS